MNIEDGGGVEDREARRLYRNVRQKERRNKRKAGAGICILSPL